MKGREVPPGVPEICSRQIPHERYKNIYKRGNQIYILITSAKKMEILKRYNLLFLWVQSLEFLWLILPWLSFVEGRGGLISISWLGILRRIFDLGLTPRATGLLRKKSSSKLLRGLLSLITKEGILVLFCFWAWSQKWARGFGILGWDWFWSSGFWWL